LPVWILPEAGMSACFSLLPIILLIITTSSTVGFRYKLPLPEDRTLSADEAWETVPRTKQPRKLQGDTTVINPDI
jgi:hypothetical protein